MSLRSRPVGFENVRESSDEHSDPDISENVGCSQLGLKLAKSESSRAAFDAKITRLIART